MVVAGGAEFNLVEGPAFHLRKFDELAERKLAFDQLHGALGFSSSGFHRDTPERVG